MVTKFEKAIFAFGMAAFLIAVFLAGFQPHQDDCLSATIIEKSDVGMMYVRLDDGDVLSTPSSLTTWFDVEIGDRVEVCAKYGKWIHLRMSDKWFIK